MLPFPPVLFPSLQNAPWYAVTERKNKKWRMQKRGHRVSNCPHRSLSESRQTKAHDDRGASPSAPPRGGGGDKASEKEKREAQWAMQRQPGAKSARFEGKVTKEKKREDAEHHTAVYASRALTSSSSSPNRPLANGSTNGSTSNLFAAGSATSPLPYLSCHNLLNTL